MRDPTLRTAISQFSSTGGRLQTRAANVRAVEPAKDLPGAERGNLYMLVEVTGSGGGHPALYRRMLDAAQRSFYETQGTMAAALQRAIISAHAELRRINEALPEANWRAGITCLALQGTGVTIAQVNPALVVISHPKTVDLFPPDVPPASNPLGGQERPDVQLMRANVEPGSTILIAENRWLEHVRPEVLAATATGETPAQVAEYLGQLAGEAELSALIIGINSGVATGTAAGPGPAVAMPVSTAPDMARPAGTPVVAEPAEEEEAVPAERGRGLFGRLARPVRRVEPELPPVEPAMPEMEPILVEREPLSPFPIETEYEPEPVFVEEERPRRSPWALVLALVIIPLLIAIVVLSVWWLRTRGQEANFQKAIDGAAAAVTSAQSLPDEAGVRQRLVAAQEFLDKAKAIKPNDSRLQPVQARYDEMMDRVNKVTPLYGTVPLYTVSGEGRSLARVMVKGNAVFMLDRGVQQIDRFVLSGLGDSMTPANPPVALAKRQQVKESDQVVADLVDMTWVEAVSNQRSRLLTLDSSGGLYAYDVTFGPSRLAVGGRDQWGSPSLIAGYGGNLYVVDSKANEIWRYKPTEKGYENPPERYFAEGAQVDLAGVQSISIDGNIWLLYADGRLLKFFTGKQQAFELKGLPSPLSNPTSVVATAEGEQIYIGDTGNGRILEFNKNGQFLRQLRPAQGAILKEMSSLYLDEAAGMFYILTNNALYKANLPKSSGASTSAAPASSAGISATPAPTAAPAAAPATAPTAPKS